MENKSLPQGSLISYMSNLVKAQGGINLAQGIPAFEPPAELLEMLKNISFDNVHQYASGRGNQMLLEQLARFYKVPYNQFLIVNGATEAISLLFTFFKKKIQQPYSVLAYNPAYESYKNLSHIFNLPFHSFPLTADNSIDFNLLSKTIKDQSVKLVLVASPGNPLGKIWTKEEVLSLVQLSEELSFYIVFDAVYDQLYFENSTYFPIDKIPPQVFYVNAFSKLLSITGWRIGYLMAQPQIIDEIAAIHDYTGLSSPSVLQQALAFYLDKYNFGKEYAEGLRERIKDNYYQMENELTKLGFKVIQAQGGYFIWAQLPEDLTDGFQFAIDLYEKQKVAVIPGIHFSEDAGAFIRINIARHPYEISMAIGKIKKYMTEMVS
ncbi:MAG: pyridoxal phosphate-dependent aminotransferase [Salinivirgaceae bacterium]